MASHVKHQVTLTERIGNAIQLLHLGKPYSTAQRNYALRLITRWYKVVAGFKDVLTTAPALYQAGWPLKQILVVSFLRHKTGLTRREAYQAGRPTTGENLAQGCEALGVSLSSQIFSCEGYPDATVHEATVGSQDSPTVVFYLHGGGYRNQINGTAQVPVVVDCARAMGASKVYFLEYTLAPGAQFPGQLVQASRALNMLLEKHSAADLVLGGDSAGGNLALGLLAHIKKPHLKIPPITAFDGKGETEFRGAFLISPMVATTFTAKSFKDNAAKDYISIEGAEMFTHYWAPQAGVWADPLSGGASFWKAVPVKSIIITVGGFECLRDDILDFAKMICTPADKKTSLTLAQGKTEVHVQPAIDKALGFPPCETFVNLLDWCHGLRSG